MLSSDTVEISAALAASFYGSEVFAMDYTYILWLAVILLATKALGLMTEKAHQPQVVGALLAGIILGPSCFNVMESTEFIMQTAEIGVLMLMFMAGLDTDIQ